MYATAYCIHGKTATEIQTREGICAGAREHFGEIAIVYKIDKFGNIGDFIGYFEVQDTGSEPIRKGRVLDIWVPDYKTARKFGGRKVLVKYIKAKG